MKPRMELENIVHVPTVTRRQMPIKLGIRSGDKSAVMWDEVIQPGGLYNMHIFYS